VALLLVPSTTSSYLSTIKNNNNKKNLDWFSQVTSCFVRKGWGYLKEYTKPAFRKRAGEEKNKEIFGKGRDDCGGPL
jgi:hypothetical protein